MEWFEKEYKKRFESESTLEGVESAPLWDQISESIPQKGLAKRPLYWKWTLSMMVFAGMILSIFLLRDNNTNSDNQLIESGLPQLSKEENNESIITENETVVAKDLMINAEDNINVSKPINKHIETIKTDTKEFNSMPSKAISLNDNSSVINENTIESNLTTNQKLQNNSNQGYPSGDITNAPIGLPRQKKNFKEGKDLTSEEINNQIEALPIQLDDEEEYAVKLSPSQDKKIVNSEIRQFLEIHELSIIQSSILTKNKKLNPPAVAKPQVKVQRKNPWAINLFAGANFFDLKYKDVQNTEAFASDANESLGSLQVGNTFGINLEYQLNSTWSVNSGVEFNNYENKLNTILTADTMALDDYQKLRKAHKIRTVTHHNKLSTLSIPISITYDHYISKKWSIGTSVGASYSIIRSQRGRVLGRNQTILDYTADNNMQYNNFISYNLNPYFRYRFSNQLSLNINAGLSYQNHGEAQSLDLTRSSIIYNFGIGMRYKL